MRLRGLAQGHTISLDLKRKLLSPLRSFLYSYCFAQFSAGPRSAQHTAGLSRVGLTALFL